MVSKSYDLSIIIVDGPLYLLVRRGNNRRVQNVSFTKRSKLSHSNPEGFFSSVKPYLENCAINIEVDFLDDSQSFESGHQRFFFWEKSGNCEKFLDSAMHDFYDGFNILDV